MNKLCIFISDMNGKEIISPGKLDAVINCLESRSDKTMTSEHICAGSKTGTEPPDQTMRPGTDGNGSYLADKVAFMN